MDASLRLRTSTSAAAFLERAAPWLLQDEAEHNLLLGIAESLARAGDELDPAVLLATVEEGDAVVGCVFRTPPHKVGLTRMPQAALPLVVDEVARRYDSLPAVLGPEAVARGFALLWGGRVGVPWQDGMRMRIYELRAVTWPAHMPAGHLRQAGDADRSTALEWVNAFATEAHTPVPDPAAAITRHLEEGTLHFWDDGEPRTMAAVVGRTPHGARVGYVYTPPALRSRGYASACVAHLSSEVLRAGSRFCFLYTDLANPTSNAIYQRIGYRPVCDVLDCVFTAG